MASRLCTRTDDISAVQLSLARAMGALTPTRQGVVGVGMVIATQDINVAGHQPEASAWGQVNW